MMLLFAADQYQMENLKGNTEKYFVLLYVSNLATCFIFSSKSLNNSSFCPSVCPLALFREKRNFLGCNLRKTAIFCCRC